MKEEALRILYINMLGKAFSFFFSFFLISNQTWFLLWAVHSLAGQGCRGLGEGRKGRRRQSD
jgi:hypothetical protein